MAISIVYIASSAHANKYIIVDQVTIHGLINSGIDTFGN